MDTTEDKITCPYCQKRLWYDNSYQHVQQCLITNFEKIHDQTIKVTFVTEEQRKQLQANKEVFGLSNIMVTKNFEPVIQSLLQNTSFNHAVKNTTGESSSIDHTSSLVTTISAGADVVEKIKSFSSSSSIFSKLPDLLWREIYDLLPEDADRIALNDSTLTIECLCWIAMSSCRSKVLTV
ncbi:hypothetical protein DFA_03987 [Cavenderia fasciculata]|uniref:Uncharacterized protein n=1 Tax=Cavenderia fasciculata TaxID=261658 RepID=F4Q0Z2_CACFS|nr:uncharacterized protein DFA_03987 [Cavenderia fasciculata]EGG18493.1 hypothetical protein DFA_03987 [Cavenderia fasciculata]|eukprot:XP_004366397.1 hypothetical protein DFA_03987 [Cavenderia fasciculata]